MIHCQIRAINHPKDEPYFGARDTIDSMVANIFSLKNILLVGDIVLMLP
jgi:hypothetical protein